VISNAAKLRNSDLSLFTFHLSLSFDGSLKNEINEITGRW